MPRTKILLCTVMALLAFSSCKVGRFFIYNFADINDHKKFPARTAAAPASPFLFERAAVERSPKSFVINGENLSFDKFLEDQKTVAFLIIQNDTILYERYFKKYEESSIVPSFSMAKSITSILIGCAINDQLITSVDEPVTTYIPELKENGFEKVTIKHLLQMTSGLYFNEGYTNPFGHVASFYYGTNLRRAISKLTLQYDPGISFEYLSGNTQLLGLVLERALGDKTITAYLEEKLWQPLGMEYDASWSLDRKKNGLEKTFCCVNARARDFAKIGRLYLHKGNWNGRQIVSSDWVERSTHATNEDGSKWYYQYQWWLASRDGGFLAQGILGQYVYVNPVKDLIVVRLGKKDGDADWVSVFQGIADAL